MPRKKQVKNEVEEEDDTDKIDEYNPDLNIPFDENDKSSVVITEEDTTTTTIDEEVEDLEKEDPPIKQPREEIITTTTAVSSTVKQEDTDSKSLPPLSEFELENIIGGDKSVGQEEVIESPIPEAPIPFEEPNYDVDDSPIKTENKEPSILKELEHEKAVKEMLSNVGFLHEYAKSTSRTVEEVALKLGISSKRAKTYLNEYISTVKEAINNHAYPDDVLLHYNAIIKSSDKRLKYYELDHLKEIVKRYSQYDVNLNLNKTLNSNGNDRFISNNSVSHNPLSDFSSSNSHNQALVNPNTNTNWDDVSSQYFDNDVSEIKELRDGMTCLQLIKFGLVNAFGQAAKMRISAMIGPDPTPYLMDEQKMKNLLRMSKATEAQANDFIEWMKTHSKYVAQPIGWLAFQPQYPGQRPPMGGGGYGGPQPSYAYNGHGQYNSSGGLGGAPPGGPNAVYDQYMTDYYYQTGVYLPGLPPEHPMNRENLQKWKQEKREEEEMKMLNRRTEQAMRVQMLKAFSGMGEGGGGGPGGMGGNRNSLFSPEMLLVTGMGRYDRTGTDDQGNPVYGIVPNIGPNGTFGGQQQMMNGQPLGPNGLPLNPVDQTASTLGLVKEIMQTMQIMHQQQNGSTDSIFKDVMGGLVQRMMQPPQQPNQIKDFVDTLQMFQTMNGGQLFGAQNSGGTSPDPMVVLETQRLQNEKEFGLKALELKEKDMVMKQQASKTSEADATQNMKWLLETAVGSFGPIIQGALGMLLGGGRGGMGVMPGGGAGGLGGLLGQGGAMMPPDAMAGGPPGGATGGPNNAALNTIIKMEYENRKDQQKKQAEESKRAWDEQVKRRNEEWKQEMEYREAIRQQQIASGNVPPPGPTQTPQMPGYYQDQSSPQEQEISEGSSQYEDIVQVTPPPNTARQSSGSRMIDQEVSVDAFKPHPGTVIQTNIDEARRNMQWLERYISTAEEALAEKIANGEDVNPATTPYIEDKEAQVRRYVEDQEQDIGQYLDKFPSSVVEPDYEGPAAPAAPAVTETETETETEQDDIDEVTTTRRTTATETTTVKKHHDDHGQEQDIGQITGMSSTAEETDI